MSTFLESVITMILVLAIRGALVYFCWNLLNDQVFMTPYELTYFQSVILAILSNVLFDTEAVQVRS